MYNFEAFKSFRDGFLGAMEDDFHSYIRDGGFPDIEFIEPNLDDILYELYRKSGDILDSIYDDKGYIRPMDYANLGHELYVALRHGPDYTEYEGHNIPDEYILDLTFDHDDGEYHDVVLWEVLHR